MSDLKFDDLIDDQDPQSAIAAQGMKQLGKMALESKPVQNVITGDALKEAYEHPLEAGINLGASTIGSIGKVGKGIKLIEDAVPNYGKVIVQELPKPNYGKVLIEEGPQPKPNYGKVIIEDLPGVSRENAIKKKPFAEGGDVLPNFDSLQSDAMSSPQPEQETAHPAHTDFDSMVSDEDKYGTTGQMIKTGLEGAGQGLIGPLAPMAEKALGVKEEDIRAREEANPGVKLTGEIVGLAAPALLTAGTSTALRAPGAIANLAKFTQAGLLNKIAFKGGESLAGRVGAAAAKAAIDNMLIAGSDEASKLVLNDPHQSAQSAISTIGMAGLLGGGLGAGLGGVSEAWSKANTGKAGQVLADFKSAIQDHLNNPEPVKAVQGELEGLYNGIKEVPVFGEKGIKAEALAKAMPEMSDKIATQATEITDSLEQASSKLEGDPHKALLDNQIARYRQALNTDEPGQIFNATQDLKKQLQEWGKYNKEIVPLAERPFRDLAKDLAFGLRESLEDSKIWGESAKIQKSINGAFSKFLPTLQDLEKTFTTKVAGERVFDPGKVNTYMNQLGKANAEIKIQKVENFIEQAQKYKSAIDEAYASVGETSPFEHTPLNNVMNTLKEKTLGQKLADAFIAKGLTEAGGKATGAGVGALMGSLIGHGELGAIVGGHALGPFFSSVMPAIAKSVVEGPVNAAGFKAATGFTSAVSKGVKAINMGTKAIFNASGDVLPGHMYPTKEDRTKIEDKLEEFHKNPQAMFDSMSKSHVGHYLPGHDQAINETAARALQYLDSLRPSKDKQNPLDPEPVISSTEKAKYDNALDLVSQPLLILDKIKHGTVNVNDMQTIQTVYPELYQGLKSKITEELMNTVTEKKPIPYKTKMSLSAFMGQPLDSTMSQQGIMAAQPLPEQPQQQQQSAPKGTKSAPALQKMGDMAKTPGQSREQRQQLRK